MSRWHVCPAKFVVYLLTVDGQLQGSWSSSSYDSLYLNQTWTRHLQKEVIFWHPSKGNTVPHKRGHMANLALYSELVLP